LLLLAALPAGAWAPNGETEQDSLAIELKTAGIEPSREGVRKFLEPLQLTPARLDKIHALIKDLSSDDFQTREKATADLIAMPYIPLAILTEAGKHDLETEKRGELILVEARRADLEHKVFLAYRVIQARRLKGLAPLVLELLPQWQEDHIVQAGIKAVEASAERTDGKTLREVIAQKRPAEIRAAAVTALAAVFGREIDRELEGLLQDSEPRVCLAAAVALLNQENRKPLAVLVRLLEAEKVEVRAAAATILQEISGKQIDYASYDEAKLRAKGVAAWRDWVEREGPGAKLNLPVGTRRAARGRILVAVYGDNVLREIDGRSGKTLFEAGGFTYPWGAHVTAEGHRLGVDYSRGYVVEYDLAGKECWRQNVPGNPTGVMRLPNLRTLIALAEPGKVIEMDRAGKVVWEVSLDGRPTTATRLPDGNTLVSLQEAGKVVAVNRKGEVVWQIGGMGRPHTVQQLPNGNVLTCEFDAGIVKEYDRSGKVVWSQNSVNNPAQAQRLENGNTLISGADGVTEFDPKGKQVRHFQMGRSRFFAD
jgi:hypothetical protein